jgi:hypothetical protein
MLEIRQYIEERCIPEPNSGCWLWLLSVGSHGYGNAVSPWARNKQRVDVAHRVSFMAFKGPIPEGMLVQHGCDNRICVNPDHLSLGTDKSNSDDKIRKGRTNLHLRDISRRVSKELALAIRNTNEPHTVTAQRTGFSLKTILKIRMGRTHANIPADTVPALLPLLPHQLEWASKLLAEAAANDEVTDEDVGQTTPTHRLREVM